jgi:hypothetical protein
MYAVADALRRSRFNGFVITVHNTTATPTAITRITIFTLFII